MFSLPLRVKTYCFPFDACALCSNFTHASLHFVLKNNQSCRKWAFDDKEWVAPGPWWTRSVINCYKRASLQGIDRVREIFFQTFSLDKRHWALLGQNPVSYIRAIFGHRFGHTTLTPSPTLTSFTSALTSLPSSPIPKTPPPPSSPFKPSKKKFSFFPSASTLKVSLLTTITFLALTTVLAGGILFGAEERGFECTFFLSHFLHWRIITS